MSAGGFDESETRGHPCALGFFLLAKEPVMQAMVLEAPGAPLILRERPDPAPGPGEVRIKVSACGVCRTDLHVVDGELPDIAYPVVPGHEVVGRVDAAGPGETALRPGDRVGVP